MNEREFWEAVYVSAVSAGHERPGEAADTAVRARRSRVSSPGRYGGEHETVSIGDPPRPSQELAVGEYEEIVRARKAEEERKRVPHPSEWKPADPPRPAYLYQEY